MGVMNARLADFERQGVHLDGNAGDPDQDFEDAATVGIALNQSLKNRLIISRKSSIIFRHLGHCDAPTFERISSSQATTSNKYACPEGLHKGQER